MAYPSFDGSDWDLSVLSSEDKEAISRVLRFASQTLYGVYGQTITTPKTPDELARANGKVAMAVLNGITGTWSNAEELSRDLDVVFHFLGLLPPPERRPT